jgi:rare lipoprotein A
MKTPAPCFFLRKLAPLAALSGALAAGGCAQAPSQQQHAKEYFPEGVYGKASPRVVADGEDVPKGGGQYLVGKPYTVAGKTYVPSERKYAAAGLASWYGDAFHGRRTANGEIYDKNGISAAHPTMPLPSYARVTNLRNHRSIIVRVNDRGPYHGGRIMDLSAKAAEALDYKHLGTAKVQVEYVGRASVSGSDDRKLLASLRYDGQPAQLDDGSLSPVRVAEQRELPPARIDRQSERMALNQPESLSPAEVAVDPAPQRIPAVDMAPQRVALAEPVATPSPLPLNPPLPPQRPFDLGTIPGADVPVSVGRR